ncbi:hypothetical protein PQO01_09680 [Lentisphaera marina]|uniref:hypothetical protein n=1 Tax=Lentisphaera marina TaxID=1111041 RepID=UPI0023663302|nr:hypothetical protein [Lentisphaera marina]MDD7985220.1 hypothetical protein [Lentisphaera marina]
MYKLLFFILFSFHTAYCLDPVFLQKGDLIIDDNFDAVKIDISTWPSAKNPLGQKVSDGFYHFDCSQSKDKMKRITLSHNFAEAMGDFILELKIKSLHKIKAFNLGLNDDNGHCLVTRFDRKKIYTYKYKEKDKYSLHEYLDVIQSNLKDGQPYTITMEVCADKVFVHIDNEHFLMSQNPRFKNLKSKIFLTLEQGSGQIDSIKIWKGLTIAEAQVQNWLDKKTQRPEVNLDHDRRYKQNKALSDTRMNLANDPQYKKITDSLQNKWQAIRAQYPYFQNYAKRKKEMEAKKSKPSFQAALKEYKKLQDAELAYLSQVQERLSRQQ